MTTTKKDKGAIYFAFALASILNMAAFIFRAWVSLKYWNWFVVPIFGLKALTFAGFAALWLCINLIGSHRYKPDGNKTADDLTSMAFADLCVLALYLLAGWLVHLSIA